MTLADLNPSYLSLTEVYQAIQALTPPDLLRLRLAARGLARIYGTDADDLVQEAMCRALDGRRQCPRKIEFRFFLAACMRSIASDGLKARIRHPAANIAEINELPSHSMHAEEAMIANVEEEKLVRQTNTIRELIFAEFRQDPDATEILRGILDGVDGEPLRARTQLEKVAFNSKRRLVRRRILKIISEEHDDER
jgi:DNA-directed RNA polymerase specialized sigma24 family protein